MLMKKISFVLSLSLLILFSCGETNSAVQDEGEGYRIEAQIEGTAGQTAKLLYWFGDRNYLRDSTVANEKGLAVFEGDSLLPAGLFYVLYPSNQYFQLLIDKDQRFSLQANISDIVGSMKVKGSLDNELFYQNQQFETELKPKFDEVQARLDKLEKGTVEFEKVKKEQDKLVEQRLAHVQSFRKKHPESFFTLYKLAGQNPKVDEILLPGGEQDVEKMNAEFRKHYWDDVDLTDERLLHTPVLFNKLNNYITKITPQRMDSVIKSADIVTGMAISNKEVFKFVANWIALQYKEPKWMGGEAVYVHMIQNYWTPELAFWSNPQEIKGLRNDANYIATSLLGKKGMDVNAPNINGQYESIYELEAPIVVVWIYTTTCEHCQKYTPDMLRVYREWKSKGVDVYAICTDDQLDEWKKFVNKYGIQEWHNVADPARESQYELKYHIDITPEAYVLNKDRIIIAKNLKPDQLPEVFEREFAGETHY
jgi:peroxiredoxin